MGDTQLTTDHAAEPAARVEPAAHAQAPEHGPILRPFQAVGTAGAPQPVRPSGVVPPLGVLALQRAAGNRAVIRLVGASRPVAVPIVQREGDDEEPVPSETGSTPVEGAPSGGEATGGEAEDERSPRERVEDATFVGFIEWAETAIADADDACAAAEAQSNALASPYRDRLRALIDEVAGARNVIDNGMAALEAGEEAPGLTADPQDRLERLDDRTDDLREVSGAWSAVVGSGLMELFARVGAYRLAQARRVVDELGACQAELASLEQIASGREMGEAFAQAGIGVALMGAGAVLTLMFPPAAMAVAIGSAVVGLGVDACLGPGGPDAVDYGVAGVSTAGAVAQRVGTEASALRAAGSRLGAAGAVAGTVLDVLETREAIDRYEAAAARVRVLARRLDRLSREYEDLQPILEHTRCCCGGSSGCSRRGRRCCATRARWCSRGRGSCSRSGGRSAGGAAGGPRREC